jgi:hypothetical protein
MTKVEIKVPACSKCDCTMTVQDVITNHPKNDVDTVIYFCEVCGV